MIPALSEAFFFAALLLGMLEFASRESFLCSTIVLGVDGINDIL